MTTSAWQLEKNRARYQREPWSACVDLLRPGMGLHELGNSLTPVRGASLLGVEFPSGAAPEPDRLLEKHSRGADLLVAYGPTPRWPVRVDLSWRAMEPDRFVAAVELWVSVRTELLESHRGLAVRSAGPAVEVLRLADAGATRFVPVTPEPSSALGPGDGPGCLLFRMSEPSLSYVEVIHPADFHRDELSAGRDAQSVVQLHHRLFPQGLEKGVILRARVRGGFCRRQEDEIAAAEAYRALAAADPPLGN